MTRGGEGVASVPPFRLPGLDPGLGFLLFQAASSYPHFRSS